MGYTIKDLNKKIKSLDSLSKRPKAKSSFHRVIPNKSNDHKSKMEYISNSLLKKNDRDKITSFMRNEHFDEAQRTSRGDIKSYNPNDVIDSFGSSNKKNVTHYGVEKSNTDEKIQKEVVKQKKQEKPKSIDVSLFDYKK
jgi:hypothetical protein